MGRRRRSTSRIPKTSARAKSPPPPDGALTGTANPPPANTGDKFEEGPGASQPADAANPKPTVSEGVLFSDPYRSLNAIAGPSSPDLHAVAQASQPKDPDDAADQDALRDPFRSIGREVPSNSVTAAEKPAPRPGSAPTAPAAPSGSQPKPAVQAAVDPKTVNPPPGDAKPAPPVADAKPAAPPAEAKPAEPDAQKAQATAAARMEKELQLQLAPPGAPRVGPAIDVKATSEGLLISLTDNLKFACSRSARPSRSPRSFKPWTRSPAS